MDKLGVLARKAQGRRRGGGHADVFHSWDDRSPCLLLQRGFIALNYCPTTPRSALRVPITGVLFEHLFHPADLFSEGFGLALLKFSEVYQLPLDAWQF